MIVSAHQPHYLPWIGYFNKIYLSDVFLCMDNMEFTNKGFINRNRILTNSGIQYLTVPLIKPKGIKTKINELIIEHESQSNWKIIHLRTLKHHYQKAKGFSEFFPLLEFELLNNTTHNYFQLQYRLIIRIMDYLNIKTKIQFGSENNTNGTKENELIVNILNDSNCKYMLLGIGASNNYVDKSYVYNKGFQLIRQEFNHPVYYQKHSKSLVSGLSIIDLIFNTSREDAEVMVKNCGKIVSIYE